MGRNLYWVALTLIGCEDLCERCEGPRTAERCLDLSLDLPAGPNSPFPLQVGNWWRYRLWSTDASGTRLTLATPIDWKTWVVVSNDGREVVLASAGESVGLRHQILDGNLIAWGLRSDSITGEERVTDPPAPRLDLTAEKTCVGDRWTVRYVESRSGGGEPDTSRAVEETWEVMDVHRTVANHFDPASPAWDSYCVSRSRPVDGRKDDAEFCFGYGVGKVFENSDDEVERLEAWCVGGAACCGTALGPGGNPRQMCDDQCIDPMTDDAHCGGCDQPCGAGQKCVAGGCGA